MKEDESKKRHLISKQLKQKIKKKPYAQTIDGKQYIYSLLKKKNQSFFLTNQRLLILIGHEAIGYARTLPDNVHLPFYQRTSIPTLKLAFPLTLIANVTTSGENLILQFAPEAKTSNWQFICDSHAIAQEWKQYVLSRAQYLQIQQTNKPILVQISQKQPHLAEQVPNSNLVNQTPSFVDPAFQQKEGNKEHSFIHNLQLNSNLRNQDKKQGFQQSVSQQNYLIRKQQNILGDEAKTMDIKAQYQLMKKEEEQRKKLLQLQIPVSGGQSIEMLAYQHWDYEFAKAQNEYLIIQQFKTHVQIIAKTLIDQLGLSQNQRQFQPIQQSSTVYQYQMGDISLEIYLLQLTEVQLFEEKITIVKADQYKRSQQQFKNANYIVQSTRNRGRLRVPLMMTLQYKGFAVSAKANVHSTNQFAALAESLEWDVIQFERETKIERGIFEDQSNVKVVAADQAWFQNISNRQAKFRRFDIFFLTDIRSFLPRDVHKIGKDGSASKCLRVELLQDQKYENILFTGENISRQINKMKVTNEKRNAFALLSNISQSIPQKLKEVAQKLTNLDQIFTNSSELSAIMHDHGLNVRYLGQLMNYVSVDWLRSILFSEIVARSAKYFLKFDLQQSTLAFKGRTVYECNEFQVSQVIGWLNRIFGVGRESEGLWMQIQRQAALKFKVNVQKDRLNLDKLNLGFLLQALQSCGGFRLKIDFNSRPYFKANNVFSRSDFQSFIVKSKVFDPSFTDHYLNIQNKLQALSFQNYQSLSIMLNLQNRQTIDSHFTLSDMYEQIVSFLVNWLSPPKAAFLYKFSYHSLPSKLFYEVQITAIKWYLKAGSISQTQKAQELRDVLVEHINFWLGEFSPLLTQIYDIFSRYYMTCKAQKSAISFARSSLKNQLLLLGGSHFKLADGYYSLGDIQLHYLKQKEALVSYNKALQILQQNGRRESQAFVEIGNKLAQLFLQNGVIEQALVTAKTNLGLSQHINFKKGYIEAAEIAARCYQLQENWQEYSQFAVNLASIVELLCQTVQHLRKMMKVILFPALRGVAARSKTASAKLIAILNTFAERPEEWSDGYDYMQIRIADKSFPGFILQCLDSAQKVTNEIQLSGLGVRWRGLQQIATKMGREWQMQQFLCELECLKWLVSGSFMQGVLQGEY